MPIRRTEKPHAKEPSSQADGEWLMADGLWERQTSVLAILLIEISDPAAVIFNCQPERHRRVHCIWLVRRSHRATSANHGTRP
jgi:hypothetical protein